MADLYPTPTRLRLLDQVDLHAVLIDGEDSYDRDGLRVTARMAELAGAVAALVRGPTAPARLHRPDQAARRTITPAHHRDGGTMTTTAPDLREDAAPTTYTMPAEPPETVTQVWDRKGIHWHRDGDDTHQGYHFWVNDRGWVLHYPELLMRQYPLSTVPPEPTETGNA